MKNAKRPELATPVVFAPSDEALQDLRNSDSVWSEADLLETQLDALVNVRDPRRLANAGERAKQIAQLRSTPSCSRWVYYPWSGQLVHILGPELFEELRLARNRHKITAQEQRTLARRNSQGTKLTNASTASTVTSRCWDGH